MKSRILVCLIAILGCYGANAESVSADIVEFHIPAGTGNGPWNSLRTAVHVVVGQTLRIINDDSVPHRLHTSGAPCPHQPNTSAPGEYFDCVVTRPVEAARGSTYDHIAGTNAKFYVEAVAAAPQ